MCFVWIDSGSVAFSGEASLDFSMRDWALLFRCWIGVSGLMKDVYGNQVDMTADH